MSDEAELSPMDRWQIEAVPVLELLVAHGGRFRDSWGATTRAAALASTDQLAAAAHFVQGWYLGHPCPNPEAGAHYTAVVNAYSKIAAAVLDGRRNPETDWAAVYRQVQGLMASAVEHATALAALAPGRDRPRCRIIETKGESYRLQDAKSRTARVTAPRGATGSNGTATMPVDGAQTTK